MFRRPDADALTLAHAFTNADADADAASAGCLHADADYHGGIPGEPGGVSSDHAGAGIGHRRYDQHGHRAARLYRSQFDQCDRYDTAISFWDGKSRFCNVYGAKPESFRRFHFKGVGPIKYRFDPGPVRRPVGSVDR